MGVECHEGQVANFLNDSGTLPHKYNTKLAKC